LPSTSQRLREDEHGQQCGDDERGDESDDDVSLVSRTPSPRPTDTSKYDEYVKGVSREVITVETRIKSSNKGFVMLAKLGWREGQPLGLSDDGLWSFLFLLL